MALVKETISAAILDISTQMASTELPQDEAMQEYADAIAQAIIDAIMSADISGITTTGSATAQAQVPGTGILS
jgi:hypothetical protein